MTKTTKINKILKSGRYGAWICDLRGLRGGFKVGVGVLKSWSWWFVILSISCDSIWLRVRFEGFEDHGWLLLCSRRNFKNESDRHIFKLSMCTFEISQSHFLSRFLFLSLELFFTFHFWSFASIKYKGDFWSLSLNTFFRAAFYS